jgi:hypothetical protein
VFVLSIFLMPCFLTAQNSNADSTSTDTIQPTQIINGKGVIIDSNKANNEFHYQTTEVKNDQKNGKHSKRDVLVSSFPDTTAQLKKHNPKVAAWMSAAIPGLGQIYNRKYWKLPIIYVGLGACAYFAWTNTVDYRKYKETYRFRLGIDSTATDYFPNESDNTIKTQKEYHHKNIEISYIAAGLIYLLNIIDATVDAHLYDFDISNDLSLRIEPSVSGWNTGFGGNTGTGVKLTLKF